MGAPAPILDPAEIYRQSFAIIRAEADLSGLDPACEPVAVRMIHACGMTDLAGDLVFSDGFAAAGKRALEAGAPVLCDADMVARGIIARLLPARNEVLSFIGDPRVAGLANDLETTRSAAQLELWLPHLAGAVVAIGNAPTALFRLLELLEAGAPRPACIIGAPVGFVGAAESKDALIERAGDVPFVAVRGRRGGSAMAAAAVNGLAGGLDGHG